MVAEFDLEKYQTQEVHTLCQAILAAGGPQYTIRLKDLENIRAGLDSDHVQAYNFLRFGLQSYIDNGGIVDVRPMQPPRGAFAWVETMQEA
jgi:hypothetical protein